MGPFLFYLNFRSSCPHKLTISNKIFEDFYSNGHHLYFSKELPVDPHSMRRCDHFFCQSCLPKLNGNMCSDCKIITPAAEVKPDTIVSNLISCFNDLMAILNGEKIDMYVDQDGILYKK